MKLTLPLCLVLVVSSLLIGCSSNPATPPVPPPPTPPVPPPAPAVSIIAPVNGTQLASTPVSVQVGFTNGADPTQMVASLNGKDITSLFAAAVNGTRTAQLNWPDVNLGRNALLVTDQAAQSASAFVVTVGATQDVSRLVPIQTRIVVGDGTLASDYSVQVGTNSYVAPNLGNGAVGFQVVMIDRATLNLVSNVSYPTVDDAQVNAMISALTPNQFNTNYEGCGVLGCIVVIQSLYQIGDTPCGVNFASSCSTSSYGSLFENLGGSADIAFANGGLNYASYSLITNIGQGGTNDFSVPAGSAYERLACSSSNVTNPNCGTLPLPNFDNTGNAQITGVLILDNHEAYTFAYNALPITFSTGVGASPTQNTITLNGTQYASSSIPSGQGGFQVVALNRTTLALVANETFPFSQLGIMYDTLHALNSYNYLVFVSSIGSMYHATPQLEQAWYFVGVAIQQLGGTYQTFVQVNDSSGLDDYSLVGAASNPNSGLMPFYGAEASTVISVPTVNARPHSNIQGVLAIDHQGYYSPVLSSLNSTFGQNNLALVTAASLQMPVPWPYPQPGNTGQAAAYTWISQSLCCNDIRAQYTNLNSSATLWSSQLEALTYPSGQTFSSTDFDTLKTQLLTEFQYLALVRIFESNLEVLYQNQQSNVSLLLSQAYNEVQNALHIPPAMPVKRPSPLAIAEGALPVGEDLLGVAGPPGALAKAGIDGSIFGIRLALEEANDGSGRPLAPPTRVQVAELADSDIAGDAANTFAASLVTMGNGFDRIVTDWGRLQAVGEPLATGQIVWNPDASGFALQGFDIATRREYYEKFFSALYGVEHRVNVTEGGPPADVSSSCTGKSYMIDQDTVMAIPSSPTGQLPSTNNDQQNYDGYILLGGQKCDGAPSTLPDTFGLFMPLDPNQPDSLGEYQPYFYLHGPLPVIKTDAASGDVRSGQQGKSRRN